MSLTTYAADPAPVIRDHSEFKVKTGMT